MTSPQANSTIGANAFDSTNSIRIQFATIVACAILLTIMDSLVLLVFTYGSSITIHKKILSKVIHAKMDFYDQNLTGNILNKFSRDLAVIDETIEFSLNNVIQSFLSVLFTLLVVSSVKPYLLIPSVILLVILYAARNLYLRTTRSIRRLEGSTRSPVVGYLNVTVDSLTTIRAHAKQNVMVKEFENHLDLYNSVLIMGIHTKWAFTIILDVLCALYFGIITFAMLALRNGLLAGHFGLAVTQSLGLSGFLLQFGVTEWAEMENHMTSVERIMQYTKIASEVKNGKGLTCWPNKGRIVYNNVTLKYPSTGDLALKRISFSLEPKEKLGIVGRTGAGKSSLISVLFRLYDYNGLIEIDGIDISTVELVELRRKISIIPQDPYLFGGTVRNNLDPYQEFSDEQLWDALTKVEMNGSICSLKATVTDGGENYSLGQKQLICIARAILRNNLILVLDEATANLDSNMDAIIQNTIKRNFSNCTMITIAHRLSTIIDSDKVMVINEGEVVEFGTPKFLINKGGQFYNMVKMSGLLNEE